MLPGVEIQFDFAVARVTFSEPPASNSSNIPLCLEVGLKGVSQHPCSAFSLLCETDPWTGSLSMALPFSKL